MIIHLADLCMSTVDYEQALEHVNLETRASDFQIHFAIDGARWIRVLTLMAGVGTVVRFHESAV